MIGGFHYAAEQVWGKDLKVVGHVEIDKFCQKVLKKHWPNVPIYEDIKELDGTQFKSVDLITGGFPCQPFSVAGKRKGKEDNRYLWPEMLRIIQEAKPCWVIGENVTGIIHLELDNVLSSLENSGYEIETLVIPACGVDAPHRRNRVWIVAYNDRARCVWPSEQIKKEQTKPQISRRNNLDRLCQDVTDTTDAGIKGLCGREKPADEDVADTNSIRLQGDGQSRDAINKENGKEKIFKRTSDNGRTTRGWFFEPDVGRVAHGVPSWVDRLKSLGNAIVPQVVIPIMQAIKEIEKYD